ncbi:MAG: hypothetical protein OEV40_09850 [Acidimicrobiia bacterium]|nr:hypothetical protein [Acidimicrobiia bacterium]
MNNEELWTLFQVDQQGPLRGHDSGPDPGLADSPLPRYRSSLSFYAAIILTQVVLWLIT